MVQGSVATGGKIGGSDWYSYARRAMSSWNTDAIEALPLQLMEMQTLTAPTAGSDRRMFARMIEGGQKLSTKQEAQFDAVGMLDDKGGIVGRDQEVSRPDLFIDQTIKKLREHGIIGDEAVKGWATRAFNASSAAYFMTAYAGMTERDPETGRTRLEKERANLGRAQGLDQAYSTMMGTDMTANMSAFQAQWHSFTEAVGGPLAKAAIPILKDATDVLNRFAAFADKHQVLTQMGADIAMAAAGLLTLAGGVKALQAALAIRSFLNSGAGSVGAGAGALAGEAGASSGLFGKLLGVAGHAIPQVIAYEAGKSLITTGLDALPHPNYPAGYDPQAIRNGGIAGDLTRLKADVQPLIDAAESALKSGFAGLGATAGADIKAGIAGIGTQFTSAISGLPGQVSGGISAAVGAIGAKLSSALSSLASAMHNPTAAGHPDAMPSLGSPMRYQGPARGGGARTAEMVLHSHVHLDGRQLAMSVSRRQGESGRFPTAVGSVDERGHFVNPGTPLDDVD